MICVIEGTGWRLDTSRPLEEIERLEVTLDLLDTAIRCSQILYSSDLFNCEIIDNFTFYELYNQDAPLYIPPEVQERVAAAFLRLERWEDCDQWPADTDVTLDGKAPIYLPSVAWVHQRRVDSRDKPAGVICLSPIYETGVRNATVAETAIDIFFMCSVGDWAAFNRYVIVDFTKNSRGLNEYACAAFPNLEFVEDCLYGIDKMSRPYSLIVKDVVKHLAAFSDQGSFIFSQSSQMVPSLFGPLGVDISDENGATKSNSTSIKQRARLHRGKRLLFWWHSKLERHRDRIHIYVDRNGERPRIVVGILCYHLF